MPDIAFLISLYLARRAIVASPCTTSAISRLPN